MVVNLSGCFILGFFGTFVVGRTSVSDTMKLAIGVGFVGAYTTFSTLMFDSNDLVEHGAVLQAAANIVFSILLGLVTVRLGAICARQF